MLKIYVFDIEKESFRPLTKEAIQCRLRRKISQYSDLLYI